MPQTYYIAEGFVKDAGDLLNEFTQLNRADFPAFADLWRKHNFGLIFMGRQSQKELYDFTQEILAVSLSFIPSISFLHEVGTVYLLYALYRNQVTHPPVRIRMPHLQVQRMLAIQRVEPCPSLHYVVNYLLQNSIDFVACPKLFGPTTPSASGECTTADNRNTLRLLSDTQKKLKEFTEGFGLDDLASMFDHYSRLTTKLNFHSAITDSASTVRAITSHMKELYGSDKPAIRSPRVQQLESGSTSIGSRRVQLKAKAFKESAVGGFVVDSDDNVEEPIKPSLPRVRKIKRVPKSERTVGRKKKVVEDFDELEPSVKLEQLLPQTKKPKRRQTRARNYCTVEESEGSELEMWRDLPDLRGEMFADRDVYVSESDSSASSLLDAQIEDLGVQLKNEGD